MRNPDESPNIFWENLGPRPYLARTFWVKISFRPDEFPNINEAVMGRPDDNLNMLCSSVVGKVPPEGFIMRK